jgi:hypothetical protein
MFVNHVIEMEAWNFTQRYLCRLLCVKLSNSATTTHGILQQALGDDAVSRAQAFHWYKIFSKGRTLVEDEQRSR